MLRAPLFEVFADGAVTTLSRVCLSKLCSKSSAALALQRFNKRFCDENSSSKFNALASQRFNRGFGDENSSSKLNVLGPDPLTNNQRE